MSVLEFLVGIDAELLPQGVERRIIVYENIDICVFLDIRR
jgi:hypothetical protein